MLAPLASSKIRSIISRPLIYVRQSTLAQVREHTASRQYDLVRRARPRLAAGGDHRHRPGSRPGRAPRPTAGRLPGPRRRGRPRPRAVLSLEASRLARASSDWYRLLELCALTETLVVDEDGIYDPGQYDDRLLLGFKACCILHSLFNFAVRSWRATRVASVSPIGTEHVWYRAPSIAREVADVHAEGMSECGSPPLLSEPRAISA